MLGGYPSKILLLTNTDIPVVLHWHRLFLSILPKYQSTCCSARENNTLKQHAGGQTFPCDNNILLNFPPFSHILRNASIQHAFALFISGNTAQIYASVIRPKCMLNGKFQLLGKRPEPYRVCSDISQSAAIKRMTLCSSVGSNWICCVNFSHFCLTLHHQIRVMFCC